MRKKRYGLSRFARLRHKNDIAAILSRGKRLTNTHFTICYQKNDLKQPRFGVIVSKRKVRLAVNRNKIKRLSREIFRFRQLSLSGIDLIVILRKPMDQIDKAELQQCLNQLFDKLINNCKKSVLD